MYFYQPRRFDGHHTEMPMNMWNSRTIDKIVVQGDAMYRNALADGRIPDAETLSVDDLPVAVGWACEVVAKNLVAAESKQSESVMAASEPQCNANENCYSQPQCDGGQ